MDQPDKVSFAPGMTMPVVAGETYTLKDDKGESLILEGRDDPLTIDFINAYDEWIMVIRAGLAGEPTYIAQAKLDAAYEALPRRLKDNMPSRRAGIVVPGRL